MTAYFISLGAICALLLLAVLAGKLCSYRNVELPEHAPATPKQQAHHDANKRKRRWGIILTIIALVFMNAGFFVIEFLFPYEREIGLLVWIAVSALASVLYALSWFIRVQYYSNLEPTVLC